MLELLPLMSGPLESEDDFNLTVVRTANSILMGKKTRGFGLGQLVLPGGKTRYYLGESGVGMIPFNEEAAREAKEETGLSLSSPQLQQKGVLHIADEQDTKVIRLYEAHVGSRVASDSTELSDIGWRPVDQLPYEQMPQDYRLWLPHILAGYAVTAFFETDADHLVEAKVFRQQLSPLGRLEEVPVNTDRQV